MKLEGYGEDRLVSELVSTLPHLHPEVLVGPGDDCAVISQPGTKWDQLLKTDTVVEGIHFESDAAPQWIGWKAICRTLSDVAAMGGESQFALITLGLNSNQNVSWVQKLYGGIERAATHFNVEIVGGETVRTTGPSFVTVSLTGRVEKSHAILRKGGKPLDALLVTGELGGSIRGWHLKFEPRVSEGRWLGQSGMVHSMMDLSDGLGVDLMRLSAASGFEARLFEKAIPIRHGATLQGALQDGEDYELLFSVSSENLPKLLRDWKVNFPQLTLSVIGEFTERPFTQKASSERGGFQHF